MVIECLCKDIEDIIANGIFCGMTNNHKIQIFDTDNHKKILILSDTLGIVYNRLNAN